MDLQDYNAIMHAVISQARQEHEKNHDADGNKINPIQDRAFQT
jgi:hypothetical protein